MERIRKEQQRIGERGFLRRQHGRLAPSVGMPAKDHRSAHPLPHFGDRLPQAVTILGRSCGRWWTKRASLPERQIEAEHLETGGPKRVVNGYQQRRIAIAARTVREYESASLNMAHDRYRIHR